MFSIASVNGIMLTDNIRPLAANRILERLR